MKKYLLFIFILVVCFHDGIGNNSVLDSKFNSSSLGLYSYTNIDDMAELVAIKNKPELAASQIIVEFCLILPQENYNQIWKPPVIC